MTHHLLNDSQHTSAALTVNENYDRGTFDENNLKRMCVFTFYSARCTQRYTCYNNVMERNFLLAKYQTWTWH